MKATKRSWNIGTCEGIVIGAAYTKRTDYCVNYEERA